MNILLTVAYDGTNYAGWQRQENAISIQQRLEEALGQLLLKPIKVQGASRTDAGVHALGQRAAFKVDHMPIPLEKLPLAVNGRLPKDITVHSARFVAEEFSPRFNARAKTYSYRIYNAPYPNPLLNRYSAFVPQALDVGKMAQAASDFVGTFDFTAFCATGSSAKTTERTIFACKVEKEEKTGPIILMTVTGDGFLYNMVRIMAGTVMYAGMGKISNVKNIILSKDRGKAGKTMPPEGLTLVSVEF